MNRNIYMTALYDLGQDFTAYQECYDMSRNSVFKFLDFDEHLLLSGKADDAFHMLAQTYYGIMNEVKRGNNVFFMEIDCIVVKPIQVFQFDKMELFSRTSPPSFKYRHLRFDPYMNSGVKYFPATFPRELIAMADGLIKDYDDTFWGYDQVVYNWMYYQQHETAKLRTHLNFMPFSDVITGMDEKDASIIHLCSSRGAKECRDKMAKYYENL